MSSRLLPRGVPLAALAVALLAACSDSISAPRLTSPPATGNAAAVSSGLTVTSTSPSDAPRDTTLNVQVNGSGFARGAQATFSLAGVVDPRVRVNSTTYVKSSQVIANVTIAADADVGKYDAVVTNADGKKGIGTEMFEVTLRAEALPNGTHVLGVDEFGNAVGRASSSATCPSPVLPILWRADGTRVELPLGSFCGGTAEVINRSGVILGEPSGGPTNSHVLWKPSGSDYVLQDIPPAPDGYRPITRAMNDNGELAGWGQRGAELFYWSEATGWLPIQVPSGATACQTFDGINNNGVIVAKCIVNGLTNAYVWSNHDAAPQQLPTPLGYSEAYPEDINDAGVVVGYANGSQQRAVQWTPNGASYSVTVLADAGYGSVANAIAENGTIAGSLHRSKGSSPSPVYWTGVNSYRLLGMDKSGSWGEALDIASGQLGLVVGGHRGNTQALRWRQ